MTLEGAVLAVVAIHDNAGQPIAAALRAGGATVKNAVVNASALAMLSEPGFDATLLDVGDDPESFVALATAIRTDPRTRAMPVVALAPVSLGCGRLAALGAVHVAPAGNLAQLAQMVSEIVARHRASAEVSERARSLEERLRVALARLSSLRSEAQTFTHDARVLCGVVAGFAANLRDGIAGPLDNAQRGQVAQILEASNDASAMVHRFGGSVRAHTELPGGTASFSPSFPRTVRRTLLDFVELARSTMQLFDTVAAQKSIVTEFEAPEAVTLWGDAMQLKQVVTNLLVNALKFTPPGGRIRVIVRSVVPAGATSGPAARHHAELVVLDTGPGIPGAERGRVFERGVRLARDERVPGAGVGLAVVREIVTMHGGTARAEEATGGGAALVVRLPLDMRLRREPGILFIDEADAARRIVDAVRSRRDWTREAVEGDVGEIGAAIERCRAVVVVPSDERGALDELLAET